jgi:hypothetical protein
MAQATTVITLKQDFDSDELPLVRLQQQTYDDGTKEKMEIPSIAGRSVKANLYGLNKFYEASEELSSDTSDELFCYFCRILQG